jgi:ABC-2 type transport system permease protein
MKTLRRYLRLYFLITSQYVKARMSYRSDFIISCFGIFFYNIPSFFGLVVIFSNIPSLAGWSFDELMFIYGFTVLSMGPVGIVFDNIWSLSWQIQNGGFIKYYFRPLNMMFYFMSETVDLKGIPQIAIGIALVVWSSIRIGIAWDFVRVLGALSLLFTASLVMIGFMVAASSTAFWITNSHSLVMLVSRLREYARYPLTIFNSAFRFIFSVIVPIGFVAFYPVQWILHSGESGIVPFLTPIVGVLCFTLGYIVWSRGTRRWSGTGT